LLKHYEPEIESVTLVPSEGGRFEIEINQTLVYSKLENGRHLKAGEGLQLVRNYLKEQTQ
jgi:selenoprotein W-related protein